MTAVRASSRRVLSPHRGGGLVSAMLIVAALVVTPPTSFAGASPTLSAHAARSACTRAALSMTVTTDHSSYGPASSVTITATIRNISPRTCTVATGPTSPSFAVRSAQGTEVWSGCGGTVGATACAQFLVLRTLASGGAIRQSAVWSENASASGHRVAPGTYVARARLGVVTAAASVPFRILAPTGARTVIVTQANSGESVALRVGDHLIVRLTSPSLYVWTRPVSSLDAVVQRRTVTPGTTSLTTFVAMSPGHARVSAVDNPTCYPQCLPPSRLFSITVLVRA